VQKEQKFQFRLPQGFTLKTDQISSTSVCVKTKKRYGKRSVYQTAQKRVKRSNNIPTEILDVLIRHMCGRFPQLYNRENIKLKSVKYWGNKQVNIYLDSRMCFHLYRQHTSSTIWICIRTRTPNIMFLRCCSGKNHDKRVERPITIEPSVYQSVIKLIL
jgi:hypothetical protein